ncbi:MAG: SET domain-containing protein-lysine N-methyltransferase [Oligoflexia bacterium]|nr:SET domain-containing protein-lysine N-methyltransferase [Oligoflexia bacterium]
MTSSWLVKKAEQRISKFNGFGIFANSEIHPSEVIAVWAGSIFDMQKLADLPPQRRANCVQIGLDSYLVPDALSAADYVNHSCSPNAGILGDRTLVAMWRISPGQEICYDYAMTDTSNYDEFSCRCGSSECRKHVTGLDWKRSELRSRYQGYFSDYIKQMIALESKPKGLTK